MIKGYKYERERIYSPNSVRLVNEFFDTLILSRRGDPWSNLLVHALLFLCRERGLEKRRAMTPWKDIKMLRRFFPIYTLTHPRVWRRRMIASKKYNALSSWCIQEHQYWRTLMSCEWSCTFNVHKTLKIYPQLAMHYSSTPCVASINWGYGAHVSIHFKTAHLLVHLDGRKLMVPCLFTTLSGLPKRRPSKNAGNLSNVHAVRNIALDASARLQC